MQASLKRILKASAYSAATILVIIATFVLVAIGRGYFFDLRNGEVAGGGLILAGSKPDNAEVYLDGESQGKSTPARLNLRSGSYELGLQKTGYRSWGKTIGVQTSEVSWVQYPFLFPESITTNPVVETAQPLFFSQSPDKKLAVVGLAASPQQLALLEMGKNELKTIYSLSPSQLDSSVTLASVEWAEDNQHILVKFHSPAGPRFSVLSVTNQAEQFDLSADFSLNLDGVRFNATNWRELYWPSPEGLRRLDLGNQTISAVLAPNTVRFEPTREAVFLTQLSAEGIHLVRLDKDGQTKQLSNALPVVDYSLAYSDFDQSRQVILADATNQTLRLYKTNDQAQAAPETFTNAPVGSLLVSPADRFLVSYKDNKFFTHDFEFSRSYHFELPEPSVGPISWFDEYHLMTNLKGATVVFEFDGANQESIVGSLPNLAGFSNADLEFIYSFGRSQATGAPQLQASTIRI